MARQLSLFDSSDDEYQPEYIFSKVDPLLPRLIAVFQEEFQYLVERRSEDRRFARKTEGQIAWDLWTNLHHAIRDLADNYSDKSIIDIRRINQQDVTIICNSVVLVFKKLRRKITKDGSAILVRSNYKTPRNLDFWDQQILDGVPNLPRSVFGYELKDELTRAVCYLGLPNGRNFGFRWYEEITDGWDQGFSTFSKDPVDEASGFEIVWDQDQDRKAE